MMVYSRVSSRIAELHGETLSQKNQMKPTVKTVRVQQGVGAGALGHAVAQHGLDFLSSGFSHTPAFVEELRWDCIVSSPVSPRAGGISVCSVNIRGSQNADWGHGFMHGFCLRL